MAENNIVEQQPLAVAMVQQLIGRRQAYYPQFFAKAINMGEIPKIILANVKPHNIFAPEFYLSVTVATKIGLLEELWLAEQNMFDNFIASTTKLAERLFIYTERGWVIQTLTTQPKEFRCWNMFSLTGLAIKSGHCASDAEAQGYANINPIAG